MSKFDFLENGWPPPIMPWQVPGGQKCCRQKDDDQEDLASKVFRAVVGYKLCESETGDAEECADCDCETVDPEAEAISAIGSVMSELQGFLDDEELGPARKRIAAWFASKYLDL